MFNLFNPDIKRNTGGFDLPEYRYLKYIYVNMIAEVQDNYRRKPKHVAHGNPICSILLHIGQRWDLDDRSFVNYVIDIMNPLIRTFGFVSSINKGKSFTKGVTLGPNSSEIIYAHATDFEIDNLKTEWFNLKPLTYLYHSRTDLSLPIMNNTTPGKAYGVTALNIPMLALKYRYWLRFRSETIGIKDNVTKFLGGFVLPNAIESYLDIAFFNRLSRRSLGIGTPIYPSTHPFYTTNTAARVDKLIGHMLKMNPQRVNDLYMLSTSTQMLTGGSLIDVLSRPKDLVTRQNEWAIILSRLPYIKYLVHVSQQDGRVDKMYYNKIRIDLQEAKWDNTVKTIMDPWLIEIYEGNVKAIGDML